VCGTAEGACLQRRGRGAALPASTRKAKIVKAKPATAGQALVVHEQQANSENEEEQTLKYCHCAVRVLKGLDRMA